MMTSVTLPSSSGPIHGRFSTAVSDETTDSERDFEPPRPVKRYLTASLTDSCKKRRKQATPVRISAADSPPEGKPSASSPEPELRCPICQLVFNNSEVLQSHLSSEHVTFELKKEPDDSPAPQNSDLIESPIPSVEPPINKQEVPWMSDLSNKEWMNPNTMLSFPPANHMFMGLPSFSQPDAMPPRQPIRIFNPDAYCELCNKEFCNKYFLKTHKANKHGIYSDPPAATESSSMGAAVNIPNFVSNIKIPTTVPSVDVTSVKIEPKTSTIPNTNVGAYQDIYPNPFSQKLFTKMPKQATNMFADGDNQDTSAAVAANLTNSSNGIQNNENEQRNMNADDPSLMEESSSPRVLQTESTSLKQEFSEQDSMFYTSPSKMSPGQQARELDLSNRLRRIGVMNPKAFCEICCKEYCNKYFLRTHKMKRHGIFIPDDRDKDMKMESLGMPYIQTSPLNLIMGEQSNSSDRKTSSPSDISCDLCGIKFQNMSLYQLHNVSMHAKMPTNQQENNINANHSEEKKAQQNDNNIANDKAGNAAADSISEDLQKLQTMILQLNDLDVSKANSTCTTCNKDFENRYYLHAHMMTEHGLLLDDNADADKSVETDANINNNTMCDLCGKDFHNYEDMKKHIMEFHRSTQMTPEVKEEFNSGFTSPEKGAIRTPVPTTPVTERRASMNLTPTSSYCEICNKELCNKYFMKTHMQRMHGIEIENGAQIGGVICDICNKELCSKYFLRVHKHNTHGIVEYGSSLLQPRKCEESTAPAVPEPDPALKPADLADLSHRYFTHFTEVCTICSRRFRSTKWLKAHLLSDHGQAGAEKWAELEQQLQNTMNQANKSSTSAPSAVKAAQSQGERISPALKIPTSGVETLTNQQQKVGLQNVLSSIFGADESTAKTYHCSYCPFSTPILPFLFVHERSHTMQNVESDNVPIKCPICLQTFTQSDLLQHHIFTQHPFLPLPPFFNGNTETTQDDTKEPSECAEDADDVGSLSDVKPQPPITSSPTASSAAAAAAAAAAAVTTATAAATAVATTTTSVATISTITSTVSAVAAATIKGKKVNATKRKMNRIDLPPEMDQALKDVAKKTQLPATYAIPQIGNGNGNGGHNNVFAGDETSTSTTSTTTTTPTTPSATAAAAAAAANAAYVMQAFLVEELTPPSPTNNQQSTGIGVSSSEHKFMPSVVFLPVLQKLSAPITATFTLTPA